MDRHSLYIFRSLGRAGCRLLPLESHAENEVDLSRPGAMMTLMRRQILCAGRPVSLIILAGGQSRRMGRSKARLPLPGGTLLEHVFFQVEGYFDEILVSISPEQSLRIAGRILRMVEDAVPGQGPMAGILAGLKAAGNDVCAVIACDIPYIHIGFLRRLVRTAAGYEAVVPVSADGLEEPLFAAYRKKVAPLMEELLASGMRSLIPLIDRVKTRRLPLEDPAWLKNLNTPDDYRSFLASLSHRA